MSYYYKYLKYKNRYHNYKKYLGGYADPVHSHPSRPRPKVRVRSPLIERRDRKSIQTKSDRQKVVLNKRQVWKPEWMDDVRRQDNLLSDDRDLFIKFYFFVAKLVSQIVEDPRRLTRDKLGTIYINEFKLKPPSRLEIQPSREAMRPLGRDVLISECPKMYNEIVLAYTITNFYDQDSEDNPTFIGKNIVNRNLFDIIYNQDIDEEAVEGAFCNNDEEDEEDEEDDTNHGTTMFHFCRFIYNLHNPEVDEGITPQFKLYTDEGSLHRVSWTKEIWCLFWTSYLLYLFNKAIKVKIANPSKSFNACCVFAFAKNYQNLMGLITLFNESDFNDKTHINMFHMIYNKLFTSPYTNIATLAQLYFNKPY